MTASPTRELILKIGVHTGAAIAVTLNERLDYFGQTVNIAARVQQLAGADEICISGDVQSAEGVAALLGGLQVESKLGEIIGRAARDAGVLDPRPDGRQRHHGRHAMTPSVRLRTSGDARQVATAS